MKGRITPMYEFITNRGDIRNELQELIRCFLPDWENAQTVINFTYIKTACITLYIGVNDTRYAFTYPLSSADTKADYTRYDVYVCKHAVYRALSKYCNKTLPWGCLTGIRPTRLALRLLQSGSTPQSVTSRLTDEYFVSPAKASLTSRIMDVQQRQTDDRMCVAGDPVRRGSDLVNLYIHIPFCPTRCAYCSFVSEGIEKKQWLLLPYAEALCEEIRRTKDLLAEQNKRVFSVYVGGGTPTVLPPDLLYKVLRAAAVDEVEFTCEAGRPDTITAEKMQILNECGVTRVSINPQTLHDKTLQKIGRAHTTEQFYAAYECAQQFGFVKNVDLIAGLQDETQEDFAYTLLGILALRPENITVHTLCRKRGSADAMSDARQNENTEAMVSRSVVALDHAG
ncbi:MAG: radical SAM protein, partial [Clostridiales bacterium]|nr:radical SAM protein [Clostridiales bacterium]